MGHTGTGADSWLMAQSRVRDDVVYESFWHDCHHRQRHGAVAATGWGVLAVQLAVSADDRAHWSDADRRVVCAVWRNPAGTVSIRRCGSYLALSMVSAGRIQPNRSMDAIRHH